MRSRRFARPPPRRSRKSARPPPGSRENLRNRPRAAAQIGTTAPWICATARAKVYVFLTSFNKNCKFQIHLGTSKARRTYSPCLNFTAQNMHAARCFLQRGQWSWVGSEGSALFVKCTFASVGAGAPGEGGRMTVFETPISQGGIRSMDIRQ